MKIIQFLKKSYVFVSKHIKTNPVFVFLYGYAYFQKEYKANSAVLLDREVISFVKSGKSFIRLGDGEMALIKMIDIHFQKADKKLAQNLKKIIKLYRANSTYTLAIPTRYINKSNQDLKKIGLLRCWLPFKVAYKQFFNKNMKYADAHAFYVSGFFENNLTEYLKTKKIIVVTREDTIKDFKKNTKDIFFNTEYVQTPNEDAFSKYVDIKHNIDLIIKKEGYNSVVILAAMGPASKVLAYEYSLKKVQVLDIGHGIEHVYSGKALDHVLV